MRDGPSDRGPARVIGGGGGSLALVTGGTDGIGAALVSLLRDAGWRVLATGRRASDGPDPHDPDLHWLRVDQADPARAAARIAGACEGMGRAHATDAGVELAILCAGTGQAAQEGIEGEAAVRAALRVNLEASVLIAHALAPQLLARRGTLVLIGSVARRGMADLPSYAASKAGLHAFARALGEEWRGRASVLALHPGPTRTGMQGKAGLDVSRIAWAFLPPSLMARMVMARIVAERGRLRPRLATLGHRTGLLRWAGERLGLARAEGRR